MKHFVPHRYQFTAIYACMRYRFMALFLDPGMGKTSIILRMFVSLQRMKRTKAMLVVAPLRPCYTVWPKENKKWFFCNHLTTRILHGSNKMAELNRPADIYVINPEGLNWLFRVALKGKRNFPFDILVIDESGKFKNPDSKRLGILTPKLHKFNYRIILNGTPAPTSSMDLWAQFRLVDEGKTFGRTVGEFRQQYFIKSGFMGREYEVAGDESLQAIYKRAAKMCLVMEAEEYLDMPEIVYPVMEVILPKKAREHYDELEKELFTIIADDELEISSAGVAFGKCKEVANGGLYHSTPEGAKPIPSHKRGWHEVHSEKDNALCDLVEELAGKPLLIAYNFHHDLVRIKRVLKKKFNINVPHIGSGVSVQEGVQIERDWNLGKLRAVAAHPKSIAHGLNLQEHGADIFWYDIPTSLEDYIQYIRRIYRQGFKGKCVRIHHVVARNTVDEACMERLGERAKTQSDMKTALVEYRKRRVFS